MTPDWRLKTPVGEGPQTKWKEVGAGWSNPDGSIGITLGACVHITDSTKLTLFKADDRPK